VQVQLSYRELQVLVAVLRRGVASPKQIARDVDLASNSVLEILRELVRKGVLVRVERGRYAAGLGVIRYLGCAEWSTIRRAGLA